MASLPASCLVLPQPARNSTLLTNALHLTSITQKVRQRPRWCADYADSGSMSPLRGQESRAGYSTRG